jgi:glycosyltransferase involved in cell wall biosynthesis
MPTRQKIHGVPPSGLEGHVCGEGSSLLAFRRCCEHLASQGIEFAVIDNGSTDGTRAIVESFQGRGLRCIIDHPYPGFYDWVGLLEHKEELARELDSDWFMHLDADEIPEASQRQESLLNCLAAVNAEGYTAVNFDEFVFVPTTADERNEGQDYVQTMTRYFFFEPCPQRLIRAWRSTPDILLSSSGGHAATFSNRRLYPHNFVLRHYIALSMDHLFRKYLGERTYAAAEVAKGWHSWRPRLADEVVRVPLDEELFDIHKDRGWNKTRPCSKHLFLR